MRTGRADTSGQLGGVEAVLPKRQHPGRELRWRLSSGSSGVPRPLLCSRLAVAALGLPVLLIGLVSPFLLGCEEPPPPKQEEPETSESEATARKPAVDPRIEEAMAAAQGVAPPAAAADGMRPPPAGLMERQVAEREVALGAPAAIVFGDAGSAPRRLLALAAAKATGETAGAAPPGIESAPQRARLTLRSRSGGSVLPTLDLDWRATFAQKGRPELQFLLESSVPAGQQPGRLPADASKAIAALVGSTVHVPLSATGAPAAPQAQRKGGKALEVAFDGATQLLGHLALAYPAQPVGAGAYWMMKSRERCLGADTIVYRMVRVTALSPTGAKLDVKTRRYLVDRRLQVGGLPEHTVVQFQAEGSATLEVPEGGILPGQAELSERVLAMLSVSGGRGGRALPFQTEVGGSWALSKP